MNRRDMMFNKTVAFLGAGSMAEAMIELAKKQPGFINIESAEDEIGINVSYWESLDDIAAWKGNSMHKIVQAMGKNEWYKY